MSSLEFLDGISAIDVRAGKGGLEPKKKGQTLPRKG